MGKTNKERVKPDFRLNPDNIKVNDWVFSGGDIGFVEGVGTDNENMLKFMVVWNNEPPAVSVLAQNLKKLNRPVSVGEINYTIDLDLLVLSPELQQRVKLDSAVVEEYAEAFRNHVKFPPITIWYRTDEEYTGTPLLQPAYLIDGFHRVEAAKIAGITELPFIRKQGTYREALLYSTSINSTHGLRRSNADKRKSVMTLLQDEEWNGWSNREIANHCNVSSRFVDKLRNEHNSILTANIRSFTSRKNKRKYKKGGIEYEMDITNLSSNPPSNSDFPEEENKDLVPDSDNNQTNNYFPDSVLDDSGFKPENNYPEDNRYYPEDVIKDLWDDDESVNESVSEDSVNEDSLTEDSVSKDSVSNNKDKPENTTPTSPYSSKHNKPNNIKRPQKKEIVIKEGLNYFAGVPGHRCKWYIEASEEDYHLFTEYQKELNAPSISTCLARMIQEKREAKVIHTDDVVVNLSSKMNYLNSEQRLFLAKQLLEADPEIFTKVLEKKS